MAEQDRRGGARRSGGAWRTGGAIVVLLLFWVALLLDAGAYVPLAEAWDAGLPRGEREMGVALRALLEGGSFLRWVAETYGPEAVGALRDGVPVEEAIGLPLAGMCQVL